MGNIDIFLTSKRTKIQIISLSALKEVGSLLREERQAQNLSISSLADSLRIGEEQLAALEQGEKYLLPEDVFIRAMVRRVEERLKIQDLSISKLLKEDKKIKINSNEINPQKTISGPLKNIRSGKIFIFIISSLLLITLIIFASLNSNQVNPELPIEKQDNL